jgi:CBS domain-containing protein
MMRLQGRMSVTVCLITSPLFQERFQSEKMDRIVPHHPLRGEEVEMLVRDVLNSKGFGAIYIRHDATVREALALFVPHNIGSLPVVDARGRLVGIFTERDVLVRMYEDDAQLIDRRIEEVMSPAPITCTPLESIHEVRGKLGRYRVGQLPVVDGEEVVGIVTVGDLVQATYEEVEDENRHLFDYVSGRA